ncbi:MAG TPA: MBOAT family O-acyltransferase [Coriobacteriia bacterium]
MIFGEWTYGAFLVAAVAVFRVLPARARPWWLAACGLAFYAYYSPAFVWLLAIEIVVVYLLSRRERRSPWAFAIALAVTVGVLALYKYGGLVARTAQDLTHAAGMGRLPDFPTLMLPLAVSFFTFEFIHYVVDARRGLLPEHRFEEFLAFMLFFPTMVAGPIKRFQDFQPQIGAARADAAAVNEGVTRILIGLAKKICIADTLTPATALLLSTARIAAASPLEITISLVSFSAKIYMDFSGYSDIAIGSARLFGIRVPENFSWPYLRRNIAAFWRHWHMSLTSWITDYVYKPLGGNRRGLAMTVVNVMIAMAVSGLWHGAQWHFLAWGLFHGALLAGFRLWETLVKRPALAAMPVLGTGGVGSGLRTIGGVAGMALTFAFVTVGWGLFVMPVDRFALMLGRFL